MELSNRTLDPYITSDKRKNSLKIPEQLKEVDCNACSFYRDSYCPLTLCIHKQLILYLRGKFPLINTSKEKQIIKEFERLGFSVEWTDTNYSAKRIIDIKRKVEVEGNE